MGAVRSHAYCELQQAYHRDRGAATGVFAAIADASLCTFTAEQLPSLRIQFDTQSQPPHTRGVVSSRGLEEGTTTFVPRSMPTGATLSFNTDGFVSALNAALGSITAGYVMQLRQHGKPFASAEVNWAKRPSDGADRAGANGRRIHRPVAPYLGNCPEASCGSVGGNTTCPTPATERSLAGVAPPAEDHGDEARNGAN